VSRLCGRGVGLDHAAHLEQVTMMLNARLPRLCLALVFGVCYAVSASAQELNWAEKMFDQRTIDFGVVARGSDAVARVTTSKLRTSPTSARHAVARPENRAKRRSRVSKKATSK